MIKYRDECCHCSAPGYPCDGPSCPNLNVPHFYCDKCKHEVEELYYNDDEQWCADCILGELQKVEAED